MTTAPTDSSRRDEQPTDPAQRLADYAAQVASEAPVLTADQRDRLALLLAADAA